MRGMIRRGLAAALVASSVGCATAPVTVTPDTDFTLRVSEWAQLSGTNLTLRVDSIAGDSRCPVDVTCVWAGNAAVWLLVQDGSDATARVNVNTTLDPRVFDYRGRRITLVALEPAPRQGQPLRQDEYRVRLRFTSH